MKKFMSADIKKEKRDIRAVFLVLCAIFVVLSWRHYPSILSYSFMCTVFVILPIAIFIPVLLRPVFKLWMKLAHAVGWFNTQVILSLVFILIFIPTGLIMKIMRKDSMKRKMSAEGTYWEPYELEGLKDRTRYERQF
ncbi:MAG: SxtJ family membrane protein [Candidatus Scalindua sp.]|nr:SxtJ family membrane protein [Candidatus Scalindua sp.]MCR4344732.1 SxtJ family membrane protein [Candidatus Scalindua sp.]